MPYAMQLDQHFYATKWCTKKVEIPYSRECMRIWVVAVCYHKTGTKLAVEAVSALAASNGNSIGQRQCHVEIEIRLHSRTLNCNCECGDDTLDRKQTRIRYILQTFLKVEAASCCWTAVEMYNANKRSNACTHANT